MAESKTLFVSSIASSIASSPAPKRRQSERTFAMGEVLCSCRRAGCTGQMTPKTVKVARCTHYQDSCGRFKIAFPAGLSIAKRSKKTSNLGIRVLGFLSQPRDPPRARPVREGLVALFHWVRRVFLCGRVLRARVHAVGCFFGIVVSTRTK